MVDGVVGVGLVVVGVVVVVGLVAVEVAVVDVVDSLGSRKLENKEILTPLGKYKMNNVAITGK